MFIKKFKINKSQKNKTSYSQGRTGVNCDAEY